MAKRLDGVCLFYTSERVQEWINRAEKVCADAATSASSKQTVAGTTGTVGTANTNECMADKHTSVPIQNK